MAVPVRCAWCGDAPDYVAVVDAARCNGCGVCVQKCPKKVDSEFDMKLGKRKAIYTPFAQAVPNVPVIDADNCTGCDLCARRCPTGAAQGERKKVHTIDQELCIQCGVCFDVCRFDAIGIR